MVIINASATLLIATVVWLIWRVVVWRRRGGDVVRKLVVTALFLVTLLIVQITQFPMKIILYDWASVINPLRASPNSYGTPRTGWHSRTSSAM